MRICIIYVENKNFHTELLPKIKILKYFSVKHNAITDIYSFP